MSKNENELETQEVREAGNNNFKSVKAGIARGIQEWHPTNAINMN